VCLPARKIENSDLEPFDVFTVTIQNRKEIISKRRNYQVPVANIQALSALGLFLACLFLSRMIVNISSGKWPGGIIWVTYLRILLGFMFAAAITLALYAFAGVEFLKRS
jgi:hypothetical protein